MPDDKGRSRTISRKKSYHTVKPLIKALLKNHYDPQRCLEVVWSAKSYFGPLGASCLERRLWIRAQLAPFQWTREVCMATLTMDELEYIIPGYREYKRVWSPEINERLSNSRKTSSLESHTSRVQNLNRKHPSKNIYGAKGREKLVYCHESTFIWEVP